MGMRRFASWVAVCGSMTVSGAALADAPDALVRAGYAKLSALYTQPPSAQREARIDAELGQMIDYDAVAQRCFATDWTTLNATQQAEATGLVQGLVNRRYKAKLADATRFDLVVGAVGSEGPDALVHTVATNKTNARETIQLDYVVSRTAPFKIVDIVIETAHITTGYRQPFHDWLTTPGQGYPYLVQKLTATLAKPVAAPAH